MKNSNLSLLKKVENLITIYQVKIFFNIDFDKKAVLKNSFSKKFYLNFPQDVLVELKNKDYRCHKCLIF
jgi:hypothetical protein